MSSLAEALPEAINKARKVQDEFKSLRGMSGVVVEPQIMIMEAEIQRAIKAAASGDVIEMMCAYEAIKGYEA